MLSCEVYLLDCMFLKTFCKTENFRFVTKDKVRLWLTNVKKIRNNIKINYMEIKHKCINTRFGNTSLVIWKIRSGF